MHEAQALVAIKQLNYKIFKEKTCIPILWNIALWLASGAVKSISCNASTTICRWYALRAS